MEAFRSCPCPLLEEPYECDSVDLSDKETKSYWLHCIVDMLSSFRNQALKVKLRESSLDYLSRHQEMS